ncbi:MAG: peptidyl-prolyl cis-trans isomerase [Chloroflexi bacterium OLB15]|nr:MAG: peptidyl-prolyl cis-trans isomerase [Chloroflexi bacterium OLB15]
MQTEPQYIAEGMVVTLAYVLKVDNEEVSRMTADEPMEYLHGYQEIVPGLEAALTGKRIGDKLSLTLSPAEGYGEYDAENFEEITRADIPFADDLEVGMDLEVEDEEGNAYLATVSAINGDSVVLDFNHPLAGKSLDYEVEVVNIRIADDEELEHGHAHGAMFYDELDFDDDDEYDEEYEEDGE